MTFVKGLINSKVNQITAEELLKYSKKVEIQLTPQQAEQLSGFLRGKNYDIFDHRTRAMIIRQLANVVGPETAREVNKLFNLFIN